MVDLNDPVTVGYGLVGLGVLMFLLEATMPGFFIGVPASILVILGVFALIVPDFNIFTIWAPLIVILVGVPATWITIVSYRRMAPPDEEPTTRTASNLVGARGVVTTPVLPDSPRGKVKVAHESWSALSDGGVIDVGTHVRVVRVDGVLLIVEPLPA